MFEAHLSAPGIIHPQLGDDIALAVFVAIVQEPELLPLP
jgi:hypothetical protein